MFLILPFIAAAQTNFIPRLVIGKKIYTDVEVMRMSEQFAVIRFEGGVAQIAFSNCPPDIQRQLRSAMGLPELSATNAALAESNVPRLGFGPFRAANVVSIEGPLAGWTKCQLQISNKTDTALLLRLPEPVVQFFRIKTIRSNDIVEMAIKIQDASAKLNLLRANAARGAPPKSLGARIAALLPFFEAQLDKKKAALQGLQDSYREILLHEPESSRVWVRQTGQVYESITVWECPKPAGVPTS